MDTGIDGDGWGRRAFVVLVARPPVGLQRRRPIVHPLPSTQRGMALGVAHDFGRWEWSPGARTSAHRESDDGESTISRARQRKRRTSGPVQNERHSFAPHGRWSRRSAHGHALREAGWEVVLEGEYREKGPSLGEGAREGRPRDESLDIAEEPAMAGRARGHDAGAKEGRGRSRCWLRVTLVGERLIGAAGT
jgi:hypothetical protein